VGESPLEGGRVTPGVVRVGHTVRRPLRENSQFVRALLRHLHDHGFDAVPRYVGSDERGREVFTYLPGDVPPELDPAIPDHSLAVAARLIRRLHDATAGAEIARGHEVVCHNDLSPCNFVFRESTPVGIIDFDGAAPGSRLEDLGYALFLWLNLGTDGEVLAEQARRLKLFCRAYGIDPDDDVVDAVLGAVRTNVERLRRAGRIGDLEWWQAQLDWLEDRRARLGELLGETSGR
jgi:aminoglycoside phosphotransferase (APT) family kinase protein